jgi:hypothetical protein
VAAGREVAARSGEAPFHLGAPGRRGWRRRRALADLDRGVHELARFVNWQAVRHAPQRHAEYDHQKRCGGEPGQAAPRSFLGRLG